MSVITGTRDHLAALLSGEGYTVNPTSNHAKNQDMMVVWIEMNGEGEASTFSTGQLDHPLSIILKLQANGDATIDPQTIVSYMYDDINFIMYNHIQAALDDNVCLTNSRSSQARYSLSTGQSKMATVEVEYIVSARIDNLTRPVKPF